MSELCPCAAVVRFGFAVRAAQPFAARCWLVRSTTWAANDAAFDGVVCGGGVERLLVLLGSTRGVDDGGRCVLGRLLWCDLLARGRLGAGAGGVLCVGVRGTREWVTEFVVGCCEDAASLPGSDVAALLVRVTSATWRCPPEGCNSRKTPNAAAAVNVRTRVTPRPCHNLACAGARR